MTGEELQAKTSTEIRKIITELGGKDPGKVKKAILVEAALAAQAAQVDPPTPPEDEGDEVKSDPEITDEEATPEATPEATDEVADEVAPDSDSDDDPVAPTVEDRPGYTRVGDGWIPTATFGSDMRARADAHRAARLKSALDPSDEEIIKQNVPGPGESNQTPEAS